MSLDCIVSLVDTDTSLNKILICYIHLGFSNIFKYECQGSNCLLRYILKFRNLRLLKFEVNKSLLLLFLRIQKYMEISCIPLFDSRALEIMLIYELGSLFFRNIALMINVHWLCKWSQSCTFNCAVFVTVSLYVSL